MKKIKTFFNNKGASNIIIILAITAIMGFTALVIDAGLMFIKRSQLVNAVDAAVLAGAQELPVDPIKASDVAHQYLQKNIDNIGNIYVNIGEDRSSIEVGSNVEMDLVIGKTIGFDKANIVANSKAIIGPVTEVYDGTRPLVVENQSFVYGQQVVLKEDAGDGEQGNYGAVSLGGTGSSVFENNIKFGYKGRLKVGDMIDTETGNMAGAAYDGVKYITSIDNSTFSNFKRDSLRVWTIPIVDSLDVSGKKSVQIIGFATFFVEDVKKKSGQTEIIGRFIEFVANGKIDASQTDYGLKGVKLVK